MLLTEHYGTPDGRCYVEQMKKAGDDALAVPIITYPEIPVSERLVISVNYHPYSASTWISITDVEKKLVMVLDDQDWKAFSRESESLMFMMVMHTQKYKTHLRRAGGRDLLYRVTMNTHLKADIVLIKPEGFSKRGYCVKLSHEEPLRTGFMKKPDGERVDLATRDNDLVRTNQMIILAAEFQAILLYLEDVLSMRIFKFGNEPRTSYYMAMVEMMMMMRARHVCPYSDSSSDDDDDE